MWSFQKVSERERFSSLFLFLVHEVKISMSVKEQIINLLQERFEAEEFNDCFIVEINHNNSKLEVFVDSDSTMNFEKCRILSRHLEKEIDEHGWLGEKYTLEVS